MASFVGQMRSHLELQIAVFEMSYEIEKEAGASKFGIAIEAEDKNLLLVCRHATEIHQFSCSSALKQPPGIKNIGFVRAQIDRAGAQSGCMNSISIGMSGQ